MLNIVLYEPEIPQNTGAVIRLCANTGFRLHLIEPIGFELNHTKLKRAGLDYHEYASVQRYSSISHYINTFPLSRLFAVTTHGSTGYDQCGYSPGDSLLFGPESRGLPKALRDEIGAAQCIRIPMLAQSRSLNLANAAAIIAYEAWRQLKFVGKGESR